MYRRVALPRASAKAPPRTVLPPPSLPEWLARKHDPQTRALLGFNVRGAEIGGAPFASCTPGAKERALLNLKSAHAALAATYRCSVNPSFAGFDVVGVVDHVDDFVAAVAARTGWRASLAGAPASVLAAARNAISYDGEDERWRPDRLTAEESAAIKQYTACDAAVYAAASERAASLDSVGSVELAPAGAAGDGDEALSAERRNASLAVLRRQRAEAAAAIRPLESPSNCTLLLFYHIAKTGGSYVRSLMQASRAAGDWTVRAALRCSSAA